MTPPALPRFLLARRRRLLRAAAKHGAHHVRVFGSAARGEAGPDSDVDLLVTIKRDRSYLDLVSLWQEIRQILGRKVDVVSDRGISPYLRDRILREARPL